MIESVTIEDNGRGIPVDQTQTRKIRLRGGDDYFARWRQV